MPLDTGKLFTLAWRQARNVPEPVLRMGFTIAADVTWLLHGKGVRQLESNLARIRPGIGSRDLRGLSRRGMRSYMRYYREAFTLPALSPEQIRARIRSVHYERLKVHLDGATSPVLALSHQGNWDLAGAYATPNIAPVLTVAERLEPPELFEDFVAFRNSLGIDILPFGDPDVFRRLLRAAAAPGCVVPLLADRDLSAKGVEVDFFGERARVAAGPAALAVATGAPLIPVGIYYERLTGRRRAAAGSPWGIVLHFLPAIDDDPDLKRTERIEVMTQRWADALAKAISWHPEDWHMLQKVFVADLDPERDARRRSAGQEQPANELAAS